MKILLVNNHTIHISKISSLLPCSFDLVEMENLSYLDLSLYSGIILSGGSRYPLLEQPEQYLDEINLINNFKKPILGICMGFEVICYAYGESIEYLGFKELCALKITLVKEDQLLKGLSPNFYAYECHRWKVSSLNYLESLAESREGIEIVKHPFLPHYGVQFHPEVLLKGEYCEKILLNFFELISK